MVEQKPTAKGFTTEVGHVQQWQDYNEKSAAAIAAKIDEWILLYFPKGKPAK